ncbi:UvrD-helicase domain-containing protein [Tunturiibacter gelidiferens]|uniref:UvrD-helicase domain-containing protein n=1 Tax=Tunturiibacter gelidiferens TaxID=3069689 RepID=UPI003D9BF604
MHPAQRALVKREFSGPARVTGSAGTGKTIVALHRAVYLAQSNPSARVLLTTFSEVLAHALENRLRVLIANRPRLAEQIEVLPFEAVARRLYASNLAARYGEVKVGTSDSILSYIRAALATETAMPFPKRFIVSEWTQVVDAAQLRTWEAYRDYNRLGRRSRLREPQRQMLWVVFAKVLQTLAVKREMTTAAMFTRVAGHYVEGAAPRSTSPWWTRRKTSAWPNCAVLARLGADDRTRSSLLATLGNASSSSPSRGSLWG